MTIPEMLQVAERSALDPECRAVLERLFCKMHKASITLPRNETIMPLSQALHDLLDTLDPSEGNTTLTILRGLAVMAMLNIVAESM
jgi:hypothetical protein